MNRDIETEEAIALPDDFAERVLREVEHRRARRRHLRGLGAGLALAVVVLVAGRLPGRLVRQLAHHSQRAQRAPRPPALALAADPGGGTDDPLGDDANLDPESLFASGIDGAPQAPDLGDDPDSALLGGE